MFCSLFTSGWALGRPFVFLTSHRRSPPSLLWEGAGIWGAVPPATAVSVPRPGALFGAQSRNRWPRKWDGPRDEHLSCPKNLRLLDLGLRRGRHGMGERLGLLRGTGQGHVLWARPLPASTGLPVFAVTFTGAADSALQCLEAASPVHSPSLPRALWGAGTRPFLFVNLLPAWHAAHTCGHVNT